MGVHRQLLDQTQCEWHQIPGSESQMCVSSCVLSDIKDGMCPMLLLFPAPSALYSLLHLAL